jgi:peptidyl-prolyl cis-trans isomerase D
MLQSMRDKSQGWGSKVLAGLIALAFAGFGWDSFFGGGNPGVVAEVNGRSITETELNRAVSARRNQIMMEMGDEVDPAMLEEKVLRQSALDSLIERHLMMGYARDLDFAVASQLVDRAIVSDPALQRDGQYDPEMVRSALARAGLGIAEFRSMIGADLLLNQLENGLLLSSFSTRTERDRINALMNQRREVRLVPFEATEYLDALQVDEAGLNDWFEQNKKRFATEEQIRVEYLVFDPEKLIDSIVIPEEDIRAQYDRELADLKADRPRGDVWHVLYTGKDARALAEKAISEIQAGAVFEDVARRDSGDEMTVAVGGRMDDYAEGFLGDDFDDAVQALEPGSMTLKPVRTDFGWHVIRLTAPDNQSPLPSYESRALAIEAQLKKERALKSVRESGARLGDLAFESENLGPIADAFRLEVLQSDWISRTPVPEQQSEDITQGNAFRVAAFHQDVLDGMNSEPVALPDGRQVVLRKLDYRGAEEKTLEAVRTEAEEAYRVQLAAQRAAAEAGKHLQAAQAGKQLSVLLPEDRIQTFEVTRHDPRFPEVLVKAIYSMKMPEKDGKEALRLVESEEGAWLVALTDIHVPELRPKEARMVSRMMDMQMGYRDYALFREGLKARSDIKQIR